MSLGHFLIKYFDFEIFEPKNVPLKVYFTVDLIHINLPIHERSQLNVIYFALWSECE